MLFRAWTKRVKVHFFASWPSKDNPPPLVTLPVMGVLIFQPPERVVHTKEEVYHVWRNPTDSTECGGGSWPSANPIPSPPFQPDLPPYSSTDLLLAEYMVPLLPLVRLLAQGTLIPGHMFGSHHHHGPQNLFPQLPSHPSPSDTLLQELRAFLSEIDRAYPLKSARWAWWTFTLYLSWVTPHLAFDFSPGM